MFLIFSVHVEWNGTFTGRTAVCAEKLACTVQILKNFIFPEYMK